MLNYTHQTVPTAGPASPLYPAHTLSGGTFSLGLDACGYADGADVPEEWTPFDSDDRILSEIFGEGV